MANAVSSSTLNRLSALRVTTGCNALELFWERAREIKQVGGLDEETDFRDLLQDVNHHPNSESISKLDVQAMHRACESAMRDEELLLWIFKSAPSTPLDHIWKEVAKDPKRLLNTNTLAHCTIALLSTCNRSGERESAGKELLTFMMHEDTSNSNTENASALISAAFQIVQYDTLWLQFDFLADMVLHFAKHNEQVVFGLLNQHIGPLCCGDACPTESIPCSRLFNFLAMLVAESEAFAAQMVASFVAISSKCRVHETQNIIKVSAVVLRKTPLVAFNYIKDSVLMVCNNAGTRIVCLQCLNEIATESKLYLHSYFQLLKAFVSNDPSSKVREQGLRLWVSHIPFSSPKSHQELWEVVQCRILDKEMKIRILAMQTIQQHFRNFIIKIPNSTIEIGLNAAMGENEEFQSLFVAWLTLDPTSSPVKRLKSFDIVSLGQLIAPILEKHADQLLQEEIKHNSV